ncbi:MAG: YHS domain-containing (seleno)protein [Ruegeria sp.]
MTGYDAVSYFRDSGPMVGLPGIAVTWKGAEWHFANQENREAFERNPRAYAPRFGGYCAYAMAYAQLSSTDPMAWKIADGRLYLTHSAAVEKIWLTDMATYIRKAEANWPAILYS